VRSKLWRTDKKRAVGRGKGRQLYTLDGVTAASTAENEKAVD